MTVELYLKMKLFWKYFMGKSYFIFKISKGRK